AAGPAMQWGSQAAGDVPLTADVDGDGKADLVAWRPSSGTWFLLLSSNGYDPLQSTSIAWGLTGDTPLLADLDRDGRPHLIPRRPGDGRFNRALSSQGYDTTRPGSKQWGNQSLGDVPFVKDVDGDRRADLVVWRASTGTWFFLTSSSGYDYASYTFKQWGNQA